MIYDINDNADIKRQFKNTSHMTAFCSASKGNGKTWLAATLCHSLALCRKKILFFDADCGLENAAFQLDFKTPVPYAKLINGALTLNNAASYYNAGGFDVISALSGENSLALAPVGRVQILGSDLAYFSNYYDAVFLDCCDEDLKTVNVFFQLCGTIIIIVNTDMPSLTQAYNKILRLKKINPSARLQVVINHARNYEEGRQIYKILLKAVEQHIHAAPELLGIIRQDPHIREAVVNKSLLLKRYPVCSGAEDTTAIAKKILEEHFSHD